MFYLNIIKDGIKMNVLITGGCGFIGSHLVDKLLKDGHNITVIDNLSTGRLNNLKSVIDNKNINVINEDICNYSKIVEYFKNIDWVFHMAALADIVPSIQIPEKYFVNNVNGTFSVLQASRNSNIKKFLYAASSSCYGIPDKYPTDEKNKINPQYPYALTKYMAEELVLHWGKVYKIPIISLRLFNVYGLRSRTSGAYGAVFGVFLKQKLANKPYTIVGDGNQTRDFIYVTDVVNAFVKAAESNISNEIFNVGSGGTYSINNLVKLLGGDYINIPKRPGEPDCTFADISKIKNLLHWTPKISFEEGVRLMVNNIENWRDAPLWTPESIQNETVDWFKYLS